MGRTARLDRLPRRRRHRRHDLPGRLGRGLRPFADVDPGDDRPPSPRRSSRLHVHVVPGRRGATSDRGDRHLPNQEAATRLYVSKTAAGGVNAAIWLAYLNRHSSVTFVSAADEDADPPIHETRRGYELTADVIEHGAYYELPVFWTSGTEHVPTDGPVTFTLTIGQEVPQLWQDIYGVNHYGRMTFNRTDLINTDRDLFEKLADRILEVRGSNSVPRLEAVTLDARTGDPMSTMRLMSSAAPEKPSRYRMHLEVGTREVYDRMCFATAVRHFIAPNEWTLRITLDIAEWAAQL